MNIFKYISVKLFILTLAIAAFMGTQIVGAAQPATGLLYYVSRTGNNADGKSWSTAWNNLDQINWNVVQPGDTILLDGGSSQMTYPASLAVGKSGTIAKPITIRLASEAGRNGQAIIFGGRSTLLPSCGQSGYVFQTAGVRSAGVLLGDRSWVVIDGTKWHGITIYGHNKYGIDLSSGSNNIAVRNVEIYDNGEAYQSGGHWNPNQEGVKLSGTNITFERAIIHDNGQDAFQSGGGLRNFTLRESWLYNGREHPTDIGYAFNHCRHPDGLQIYNGGVQSGVLFESTIIGPGFNQGVILGQSLAAQGQNATVNDVTIRNSLFIDATGTNIMGYPNVREQNWRLENVTAYMAAKNPAGANHNAIYVLGSGHAITNSIFYQGNAYLPDGNVTASGNCQWQTTGSTQQLGALHTDPLFVSDVSALGNRASLATKLKLDFALRPGSACAGKGSSITSIAQLLSLGSVTPAPNPTPTPVPQPTPQPTPQPDLKFAWEAEQGTLQAPFVASNGSILQNVETIDPAASGRAVYRFTTTTPGTYIIKAVLSAPDTASNSLFVNIDGEPSTPTMIWDAALTKVFQEQIVSWRGSGTPTANQFTPAVFSLAAGDHTLILRGRERNLRIDRITVERR